MGLKVTRADGGTPLPVGRFPMKTDTLPPVDIFNVTLRPGVRLRSRRSLNACNKGPEVTPGGGRGPRHSQRSLAPSGAKELTNFVTVRKTISMITKFYEPTC